MKATETVSVTMRAGLTSSARNEATTQTSSTSRLVTARGEGVLSIA
ncbi:MAG: hypothetical protein ACXWJJ_10880 [Ramlibacter sp.]